MSLSSLLSQHNIDLNSTQIAQLEQYADLLIEWNQKFNLTAITDKQDVYLKHFLDCLLLQSYNIKGKLIDVGTGAGFPGIVLKIANPDLDVTLLEPNNKKITFLNEVIRSLSLSKITTSNQRSEDYAKDHRESFDYVTSRAVAALNILDELCIPLLKVGGHFLAMKGPKAYEEIKESEKGLAKLNSHVVSTDESVFEGQTRIIIDIIKDGNTNPIYPRNYAQIKKKPL